MPFPRIANTGNFFSKTYLSACQSEIAIKNTFVAVLVQNYQARSISFHPDEAWPQTLKLLCSSTSCTHYSLSIFSPNLKYLPLPLVKSTCGFHQWNALS